MTPRSPRSLLPRLSFCRLRLEVRILERCQQQCEVRLQLSSLQEGVIQGHAQVIPPGTQGWSLPQKTPRAN